MAEGNSGNGSGFLGAMAMLGSGIAGSISARSDSKRQADVSRKNTRDTIRAQKEMAELAYQRQLEMWHLQNAYNSPQSQMQRYVDAGLNPHLIYGQGTPGNASSFPQYQAPDLQYKYTAEQYGPSTQMFLNTIMDVGLWLQSMRQGEANIRKTVTETDRVDQVMDFMAQQNPQQIQALKNKNELYGYQRQAADYANSRAWQALVGTDLQQRYDYGHEAIDGYGVFDWSRKATPGGKKGVELEKARADLFVRQMEAKLKEAQASWTEFDVTNPQALMQMVLSGVLGMAGAGLSIRNPRRGSTSSGKSSSGPEKVPESALRKVNPKYVQGIEPSWRTKRRQRGQ